MSGFETGDRVMYDPRWKSGRRLYATIERCPPPNYAGYTILALVTRGVGRARIIGVRPDHIRPMSAVDLLAEVVG